MLKFENFTYTFIRRCGLVAALFCLVSVAASAQTDSSKHMPFKIGEKLVYSVDFERFTNVAYFETHVVSKGKLSNQDAIEVRSTLRTLGFVSAMYAIDEARVSFVSPETGFPIFTSRTQNGLVQPRRETQSFLSNPTQNFDPLTFIYRLRQQDGIGTFNIQDGDRIFSITSQPTPKNQWEEKVRTDVGQYDANPYTLTGDYLADQGIREAIVFLANDEQRTPVAFVLITEKGEFRGRLSSIRHQLPSADSTAVTATPEPMRTPRPGPTPIPVATPRPYVDNQSLGSDLPFSLGESLEYRITSAGIPVANFSLNVKERKQFAGADSLLLSANITSITTAGNFASGDSIRVFVDPESLGPIRLEIAMSGSLSGLNQVVSFDPKTNVAMFKGNERIEIPVGTHSILSLVYAMRSFNLKPSKDTSNPVNDTRVSVFWDNRPAVFTLRPSEGGDIVLNGEKLSAQLISITTRIPQLDSLNLRVWLSIDSRRLPLRIAVGNYQADLVAINNSSPVR